MIGPFIFMDHIGPEVLAPGRGVDVPPHPHIDLATVTYLFEGDLVHRDSLGYVQTIRPGEINWMQAGRGIVHSERTGPEGRERESRIHGLQLWVALPQKRENSPPEFHHYAGERLPVWHGGGARARVLVGEAFGMESPVVTASPTLYVDVDLSSRACIEIPKASERAVYVVDGRISIEGAGEFDAGSLVVVRSDTEVVLSAPARGRVVFLGGAPVDGERHIWWNFVSSSPDRIQRARRDWGEGRFPPVPGDDAAVPLPE